jgi:hypothetical protein
MCPVSASADNDLVQSFRQRVVRGCLFSNLPANQQYQRHAAEPIPAAASEFGRAGRLKRRELPCNRLFCASGVAPGNDFTVFAAKV